MSMIDERPKGFGEDFRTGNHVNRKMTPGTWAYIDKLQGKFRCAVKTITGDYFSNVLLPSGSVIDGKPKGRFGEFREGQRVFIEFAGGSVANPVVVQWYPSPAKEKHAEDLKTFLNSETGSEFESDQDSEDFIDFHPSGYLIRYTEEALQVEFDEKTVFKLNFADEELEIDVKKLKITGDIEAEGDVTWKKGTPEEVSGSKHGHPPFNTKPIPVSP